jgi:hypothetical protein
MALPMTVFEYMVEHEVKIDKRHVNMFWGMLDTDWIYLSPQMITRDLEYKSVSKFYATVLRPKFKETDENDPAVVSYTKLHPPTTHKRVHTRGGSNKRYYLATPRCVKSMCVSRNSRLAKYFIQVEELFLRYTRYQCQFYKTQFEAQREELLKAQHIIEHSRRERINELDEAIHERHRVGCIYYIDCVSTNYTKVGYTYNLPQRLNELQVACPFELRVSKTELCQYPVARERELHEQLADRHVRGEWYDLK